MTAQHSPNAFDYLLVGGGLQAGLIVMALRHQQPTASILLIEQADKLAGNHTWSFHPDDVPGSSREWVEPLIQYRWDACEVRLSGLEKRIPLAYATTSSEHFASVVKRRMNDGPGKILLGTSVAELMPDRVRTQSGDVRYAKIVIDCRGPNNVHSGQRGTDKPGCGFQKFWGFEVETQVDWPRQSPTIMDDCVDQTDGFRFIYSLPLTPRQILVEDTRFSSTPELSRDECLANVREYLHQLGMDDWRIRREENGVLPMPYQAAAMPDRLASRDVLAGGYAGGWYHAATGYSFPMAVALAQTIASVDADEATHRVHAAVNALAAQHVTRTRFARFLNRLLFCLVKPKTRYQIFRRFYNVLPPAAIARFYAHRFTARDAMRIVVGMPPRGLRPIHFAQSFLPPRKQTQTSKFLSPVHPSARSEVVQ